MISDTIHVIDFEGSNTSGVLEWGVVTLKSNKIINAKTRLCGTKALIDLNEERFHKISTKTIEGLKPFSADWDFFANLRRDGPLCAHNSYIENNFLKKTWAYCKKSLDYSDPSRKKNVSTWGPWLDTLEIYRNLYPNLNSYQLSDLIKLFKLNDELKELAKNYCPISRSIFHCALYDALGTAILLKRLMTIDELSDLSMYKLFLLSSNSKKILNKRIQKDLL